MKTIKESVIFLHTLNLDQQKQFPSINIGDDALLISVSRLHTDLLWTAPELLRPSERAMRERDTRKADVYSFAIILQEILFQTHAYDLEQNLYPEGKNFV